MDTRICEYYSVDIPCYSGFRDIDPSEILNHQRKDVQKENDGLLLSSRHSRPSKQVKLVCVHPLLCLEDKEEFRSHIHQYCLDTDTIDGNHSRRKSATALFQSQHDDKDLEGRTKILKDGECHRNSLLPILGMLPMCLHYDLDLSTESKYSKC